MLSLFLFGSLLPADFNITRRVRRRKLQNGAAVQYTRHVLNYRDPKSGQRRQEFFERAKDAQARRAELMCQVASSAANSWWDFRRGGRSVNSRSTAR